MNGCCRGISNALRIKNGKYERSIASSAMCVDADDSHSERLVYVPASRLEHTDEHAKGGGN